MLLDDSFLRFFIISTATLLIGSYGIRRKSSQLYKIIVISLVLGLFVYSGIGAIYQEMPVSYMLSYIVFLVALTCSLRVSYGVLRGVNETARPKIQRYFNKINKYPLIWFVIIILFIFLHLLSLVIPENRLQLLLNPPAPNVMEAFQARFDREQSQGFDKIIEYLKVLLWPVFLVAIYQLRNRIYFVIIPFFMIYYISYVAQAYNSRGTFVSYLFIIGLGAWLTKPKIRNYILIAGLLLIPLLLLISYIYQIVRIGGLFEIDNLNTWDAIWYVLEGEIKNPVVTGIPLMQSEKYANLEHYLTWIATLPLPKILTGQITDFRLNDQVSSIVLGVSRGDYGFYILLPGLVMEAIFLYGKYFFWIHAVSIGIVSVIFIRLLENIPEMSFLYGYLSVLSFYVLNRAGFTAWFPSLVNGLAMIYVIIFLSSFSRKKMSMANFKKTYYY